MEIWKDIEGYEGLYQVSNLGNVRRVFDNHLMAIYTDKNNYKKTYITKNKKQKMFTIHRLIAQAFIPNPDNKPCINHIDGNKQNNNISNLEWCTYSENSIHAFKLGLCSNKGEKHPNTKLTDNDVYKIKQLLNEGKLLQKEIAEMFGVTRFCVSDIKHGKSWTHI